MPVNWKEVLARISGILLKADVDSVAATPLNPSFCDAEETDRSNFGVSFDVGVSSDFGVPSSVRTGFVDRKITDDRLPSTTAVFFIGTRTTTCSSLSGTSGIVEG